MTRVRWMVGATKQGHSRRAGHTHERVARCCWLRLPPPAQRSCANARAAVRHGSAAPIRASGAGRTCTSGGCCRLRHGCSRCCEAEVGCQVQARVHCLGWQGSNHAERLIAPQQRRPAGTLVGGRLLMGGGREGAPAGDQRARRPWTRPRQRLLPQLLRRQQLQAPQQQEWQQQPRHEQQQQQQQQRCVGAEQWI